jgi:release factor glutamine methyltransferase
VLEVIQKSSEFLAKKGVDSPRLQTELLLAHQLKLPRMKLYLNFERVLSPTDLDTLRASVMRRAQREPLQHIIGSTSFCGLEMLVNKHVLIPRPETELLAELAWQFLSTLNPQPSTCLDFGTGSGCITIAIAAKCPTTRLVALDVSVDATTVAKQNATANGVIDRIEFRCGDGFATLNGTDKFDLIVSNPPYIASEEIATLEMEVRDFDPRGALDGGADGLDFYRRLASEAGAFLKPGGKIMIEFGEGQAAAISEIFAARQWTVESVHQDYTKRERMLVARQS